MRVLMIGAYPLEPGVVNGGIESATSTLVPALAERDDIESVTVCAARRGPTTGGRAPTSRSTTCADRPPVCRPAER